MFTALSGIRTGLGWAGNWDWDHCWILSAGCVHRDLGWHSPGGHGRPEGSDRLRRAAPASQIKGEIAKMQRRGVSGQRTRSVGSAVG